MLRPPSSTRTDTLFPYHDALPILITQAAPSEFQLQQMTDILRARLAARKIDARCLEFGDIETNLAGARQKVTVRQGIERELAKKIQDRKSTRLNSSH